MRIKISKENDELLYKLKTLYNFKNESVVPRIVFSYSLLTGKIFDLENEVIPPSDGKEFRDGRTIFGSVIDDTSNYVIYKSVLDQHYNKNTFEEEFIKLFKLHLNHGLNILDDKINKGNISKGDHIEILMKAVQSGLALRKNNVKLHTKIKKTQVKEYDEALSFDLGKTEDGENVEIRINDLREFDNRNIAIAGMAGSGKTQLMKDILYQISSKTNHELKFIFFDYKGEGNPEQLKPFLDATKCEFVDIVKDGGLKFNPFLSVSSDKGERPFSIKALVDTIATFVQGFGFTQKMILNNVITELFDDSKDGSYPKIDELFEGLQNHYEEIKRKPDSLYAIAQELSTNIFNCSEQNPNILDKSIYLNLPPALSDTLRQLVVFLLLRYFLTHFSSTNDCEPKDHIFPLRYVIVIDEAHIYLKNKNARKALEELLRLLRSKGVIIIMLSQGVEDFKQKDFDFASQVQLPICLNVQNKDYKSISHFVGTPSSKYKLETEIKKLDSGKGLINVSDPQIIQLNQWWKTKQTLS